MNRSKGSLPDHVRPFGAAEVVWIGIVIFTLCFVGIVLNSLVIAVFCRNKGVRTIFMFFLVSLSVSDLISALVSPLCWYQGTIAFDVWKISYSICKLFWSVNTTTTFATSMHILSFTTLRYVCIYHTEFFEKISKRAAKLWIVSIWVFAVAFGFVAMWIFTGAEQGVPRNRTTNTIDAKWAACTVSLPYVNAYRDYIVSTYTIFVLLPMSIVIVLSVLIGKSVRRYTRNSIVTSDAQVKLRIKKERQALIQLLLIVIAYLVGYIPLVTFDIWGVVANSDMNAVYWFGFAAYICRRFSECIDPILYNTSSSEMKTATLSLLGKCCGYLKLNVFCSSTSGSNLSEQPLRKMKHGTKTKG